MPLIPPTPKESVAASMEFAAEVAKRAAEKARLKDGLTSWRLPPGLSLLVGMPGSGKTKNLILLAREAMDLGLRTLLYSSDVPLLDRLGPLDGIGSTFLSYTSEFGKLVEWLKEIEQDRFLVLVDDLDILAQDQVTSQEAEQLGAVARKLATLSGFLDQRGHQKNASVLATYTPPRNAVLTGAKPFQGPAALSPFPRFLLV